MNNIRDVVPDNVYSKITFCYDDVTDQECMNDLFKNEEIDGVFHLATQSYPPTSSKYPGMTFKTNANGTVNIANAIARFQPKCRLMFCSTSEVYGVVPRGEVKTNEKFPIQPINPYGVSKAAADSYVRERTKSCQLKFFVARAFSHTGPRRGHISSISSDTYQIVGILKGYQKKRVVMDVMKNFETGEPYNLGGDDLYSMGELLDKMLDMKNLKGKVEIYRDLKLVRPIDIPVQICDSSKCKKLTGWKPEIPVEKSL